MHALLDLLSTMNTILTFPCLRPPTRHCKNGCKGNLSDLFSLYVRAKCEHHFLLRKGFTQLMSGLIIQLIDSHNTVMTQAFLYLRGYLDRGVSLMSRAVLWSWVRAFTSTSGRSINKLINFLQVIKNHHIKHKYMI